MSYARMCTLVGIALLVLVYATSAATAASFGISPAGRITSTSLGLLTFESNVFGVSVKCNVELIGTLAGDRVTKVAGTAFGSITSAEARNCTGGRIRFLVEARSAWSLNYRSILGTLPEAVTGVAFGVESAQLLVEISGLASCLYRGRLGDLLGMTHTTGTRYTVGLMRLLTEQSYSVTTLSGICPTEPTVIGTLGVSPRQTVIRDPRPAVLTASPTELTVERLETNDTFRLTNSGELPGQITAVARDFRGRSEEFPVLSGCPVMTTIAGGGGTCTVTVERGTLNPNDGSIEITYSDGAGGREHVDVAPVIIEARGR